MDFEDIKWWLEDNWKTLVGVLGVLGIVGLAVLIFYVEADRNGELPDSYEEQIVTLQEGEVAVKETLALFDQVETSTIDGQVVYEIDLYNKKPFIKSADLELVLNQYVENMKIVEGTYDKQVRAVKFNLYDRKIEFDMGAKPDGVYYYGIPYVSLPEEEKEDVNSRYYYMSPDEVAYEYTSLYAPEEIDDSLYQLYGSYKELKRVPGVEPLTDQEYNWYVKLDMYTTMGSESGSLYLEWELGAPKGSAVSRLFRQDVRDFKNRLTAIGDTDTIFTDDSITSRELKQNLVIENPSFLLYAETEQIVENAIEARSILVEKFPGDYQETVNNWVRSLAEEQVRQMQEGVDPATTEAEEAGDNVGGLGEEDAPNLKGEQVDPNALPEESEE